MTLEGIVFAAGLAAWAKACWHLGAWAGRVEVEMHLPNGAAYALLAVVILPLLDLLHWLLW
jgi:hypothetical protein